VNMRLIARQICSALGAAAVPPLFPDDNQSFSDDTGVGDVQRSISEHCRY
jgi:hypothetical protein